MASVLNHLWHELIIYIVILGIDYEPELERLIVVDCSKYSLLIIDAEKRVCNILVSCFESRGFRVMTACSVREAWNCIRAQKPDLIVSDVRLWNGDGIPLYKEIENEMPEIKHVLITDTDIDYYFPMIRKANIGDVLVKGPDFDFNEAVNYVQSILTGNFFGLHCLFPENEIQSISISNYAQAREVCSEITRFCPQKKGIFLEIAIDEFISNAFFHALLNLSGLSRECWLEYSEVKPDCAINVTWARDNEKIGVSVEDPQGNLKKRDVLKWLDTCRKEKEIEEHGRGFLLVRRLIDRMIINIDPGKRTECIAIQYYNQQYSVNKPLMIHEL